MENDPIVVSIIVPIYKKEEYLEQCIESLVHQTYPNLDIILIDDGSPVINNVVEHPRCCRSANNKTYIVATASPTVPKTF